MTMEDFKQMQMAVVSRLRKALCKPVEPAVVEPEATPEVESVVEKPYVSTHEYDKDGRLFFPSK
jgi:hypothetical protein